MTTFLDDAAVCPIASRIFGRRAGGFLAQHVLSRLDRRRQHLPMQQVRHRDDHRIDVGIGQQLLIIVIACDRMRDLRGGRFQPLR